MAVAVVTALSRALLLNVELSGAALLGMQLGAAIGAGTAVLSYAAIRVVMERSNAVFFSVFVAGVFFRMLVLAACAAFAYFSSSVDSTALLVTLVGVHGALAILEPFCLPITPYHGEDA